VPGSDKADSPEGNDSKKSKGEKDKGEKDKD
jgi:hypothetical protein